ncbi:FecR domain-containing protein [Nodosilinea sp. PGN35]|uniref:FecR family protein n=1 Tax=Nodosilinea sp. PGN35 TaxID=3020489 RepID=UPI0023B26D10|nr:FecR family protein [Nodosilinea sp. TSF1-S3]MDF0369523.1 FecR domain-containing protein [Nodosilinea sp. TSF1-S3]
MVFRIDGLSVVLLAVVGSAAIAAPALAEVPWAWARLRTSTNQVSLVAASGTVRQAAVADCFCPGETLNTSQSSKAEVLFNDGSLTRVGERASVRFWPNTRQLLLNRGTAAVFVPPDQGRTTIQTPNATVGIASTAVVVRYVPSRQLTLIMALADSPIGPVRVTTAETGQELVLQAGQMAFIGGGSWQVVEFDLLEFYQTSELMAGLGLDNPTYRPGAHEPLAALRPSLLRALNQQAPFSAENSILDPALITDLAPGATLQGAENAFVGPPIPGEELRRFNDAPPGVVNPLPEMPPTAAPPAENSTVEVPAVEAPALVPSAVNTAGDT